MTLRLESRGLAAAELDALDYIFTGFTTAAPPGPAQIELVPASDTGGFVVIDAGVPRQRAPGADDLLADVARKVHRIFRDGDNDQLYLHGSVVSDAAGTCALILMGRSESGKSVLTHELARRGLTYLGDDMAAWQISGGRFVAYPRPLTLRSSCFDLWPERPNGILWDDGQQLYCHPWREYGRPSQRTGRRAILVHCSYRADLGRPCSLQERPPEETYNLLRRLVWTAPALGRDRTREQLWRIAALPLYRLFGRDLEQSADALAALLA